MASVSAQTEIPRHGRPALGARVFGWSMLTILAAFLTNNVLVVWAGFPGLRGFGGEAAGLAWVQIAIYAVAIALAVAIVFTSQNRSLRWDAHLVHSFNAYLIRALFWSVFLVGVADASVAFLRAEELGGVLLGETIGRNITRANWLGPYVHVPLIIASFVIARFTRTLGFPWLALLIVGAELLIVISRFVFSYEQALMGDLVRYWYAALFLFASAYTLYDEGHVRVDILYAGLGRTTRGYLNAQGTILLGMTTAWVILWIAFNGPQSIVNAPVKNFEISQSGPFGMYVKYQMAAFIGVFAVTMLIQFVSYFFESVADKRDEPGHREPAPASAQ
ncbi:MAG TPA: TRAP transporter small permease subunit [Rhodobacterales bacterium]|nr:TRAP transporter small permease subunit [Rhodobacterales bacterium]